MTDAPILKAGPLTAETVPLLTAGRSVLQSRSGPRYLSAVNESGPWPFYLTRLGSDDDVTRWSAEELTALSYIGERGPDGWIEAPVGGWAENPVPGRFVEVRFCGEEYHSRSDTWDWRWHGGGAEMSGDIIAFRLIEDTKPEGDGSLPVQDNGSSAQEADPHRAAEGPALPEPPPCPLCGSVSKPVWMGFDAAADAPDDFKRAIERWNDRLRLAGRLERRGAACEDDDDAQVMLEAAKLLRATFLENGAGQ